MFPSYLASSILVLMLESIESFVVNEALPGLGNFIKEHGFNLVLVLLLAYVMRKFAMAIVSSFIRRAIHSEQFATAQDEESRVKTLIGIVRTPVRIAIWIIAGMLLLAEIGVDTAPLVASAGIIGVALGFGAQSLVKDVISGIFMLLENWYRVGDVVELNERVAGVVEQFTLRETVLRDLDGMVHHMTNGEIKVATNMTMDYANVNLNIGVSYDTDIDQAEEIINEVGESLAADEKWKDSISEPPKFLRVNDLGESAIEIKIVGRTKPMRQWDVTGELRRRLKVAFDEEGIEIPFPQRVLHQPVIKKSTKNKKSTQ